MTRFILAVIAVGLLTGPLGFVYRMTFSSLMEITLHISTQIVAIASSDNSLTGDTTDEFLSVLNNAQGTKMADSAILGCECCTNPDKDCNGGTIEDNKREYSGDKKKILESYGEMYANEYEGEEAVKEGMSSIFPKKDKQLLFCMTCKAYKETAPFIAMGQLFVSHSWDNRVNITTFKLLDNVPGISSTKIIPQPLSMFFIGLALVICFSWVSAVVGFRLLDVFLRIGFIIILTPLFVTAFVFPITRQYTKRGWDFLVHAILSIFAVTIGIALFMAILRGALPDSMTKWLGRLFKVQMVEKQQEYLYEMMDALDAGEDGIGAFYVFFLILIICFSGIKVLQASQVVVEGLSGLSCGIPAISGAAVVGAIRAALAPFRMMKNIALDKLDQLGIDKLGVTKMADSAVNDATNRMTDGEGGGDDSGGGAAKKAEDRAAEQAGKATRQALETTGGGLEKAGKGVGDAGRRGTESSIKAAGSTYGLSLLALVVTVPTWAVGRTMQGTGWGIKKSGKVVGDLVEKTIKLGARVKEEVRKRGKRIWNRIKRAIPNRMKQIAGKNKFSREGRRARARGRYSRRRSREGTNNPPRTGSGSSSKPSSPSKPSSTSETPSAPKPSQSETPTSPKPGQDDPSKKPDQNKNDDKRQKEDRKENDDKEKDKEKEKEKEKPGRRRPSKGQQLLTDMIEGADERIDDALSAAEDSFGDGGNHIGPETSSK